jgi:DNA processing protein
MNLPCAVALSVLHGISRIRAASIYRELRAQARGDVAFEDVVAACCSGAEAPQAVADAGLDAARRLLDAARTAGIRAVPLWDANYPPLLRAIADPPPVLWVRGLPEVLRRPAVAIVGSRAATPYALEVAGRLGGELAGRGVVVVSGLARGVDGAGHRGALAAGGGTVAVLGSGPDVIYPAEHRELALNICETGALVSELGPGAPPLPEHFPQRNRLISGISLATVVVEASDRSGSLITARCALEQGRDVLAVPGSVLGGRNRGSHALLKDGAKVVETADDILEGLGWPTGDESPEDRNNSRDSNDLAAKLTPGESYDVDSLGVILGLQGPQLLSWITERELRGGMVRLAGGRYRLARGAGGPERPAF